MDMDSHRARSFGSAGSSSGLGSRIILLGDGTELSSSEADTDMFDHDEEDLDLDQQIRKGGKVEEIDSDEEGAAEGDDDKRRVREGTPAPSGAPPPKSEGGEKVTSKPTTESPSSVTTEKSEVEDAVKAQGGTSTDKTPTETK
jgi:protein phosphatase 2C family protein 2/3